MRLGAIVPQGWVGEYAGWDPLDAWRRTTEVARQADRLGFESIWLYDHFQNGPDLTWRLADELNVDGLSPAELAEALPVIRSPVRGNRPRSGDPAGLGPPVG